MKGGQTRREKRSVWCSDGTQDNQLSLTLQQDKTADLKVLYIHLEVKGYSLSVQILTEITDKPHRLHKSENEEPPRLLPSNKDALPAVSDSGGVSKGVCFTYALQNS